MHKTSGFQNLFCTRCRTATGLRRLANISDMHPEICSICLYQMFLARVFGTPCLTRVFGTPKYSFAGSTGSKNTVLQFDRGKEIKNIIGPIIFLSDNSVRDGRTPYPSGTRPGRTDGRKSYMFLYFLIFSYIFLGFSYIFLYFPRILF